MRSTVIASLLMAATLLAAAQVEPQTRKTQAKPRREALRAEPLEMGVPGEGMRAPVAEAPTFVSKQPGSQLTSGCGGGSPLTSSSFKTFGYYNASTGTAVQNEIWTFDHGYGGLEGWTREDLTTNRFTAFQHVDSTSWGGHSNTVLVPIISGSGSVWVGFHQDQADSACWAGGLGYGNNWAQRLVSPMIHNGTGFSVDLSFYYWYDSEAGYDSTKVIVDADGVRTMVAAFTGQAGSPSSPLFFSLGDITAPDSFRVIIQFTSDESFSDEDGYYTTERGPFGMDNFQVASSQGTVLASYDFETGLQGWTPSPIPGVGAYAAFHDFAMYGYAGCGQDGNVAAFHDANLVHPAGQHERFTSPPVNISSYGTDSLNVWAEYDLYNDEPLTESLFWTWGFQYYPYVCPVTGDSTWSPPDGPNLLFYSPAGAQCQRIRSYANDLSSASIESAGHTLVPAGADSVRFFLEVVSLSSSSSGNETPLFDNIEVGVSSRSTVLHVPSPEYPTIQQGIAAAVPGDSVLVAPGVYTGALNRALDFDGTDIALFSEGGPGVTIIDCEQAARALYFHNNETSASVVDGFTFLHGSTQDVGALVYVTNSSPQIRDCEMDQTYAPNAGQAVIRVDSGSPTFGCCVASQDTAQSSGGVIRVLGGSPQFSSCTFELNVSPSVCVSLGGGTPIFTNCDIVGNQTSYGFLTATPFTMTGCNVTNNAGPGMYMFASNAAMIGMSSFSQNVGGGIIMESNSSTFSGCTFNSNTGPGITIANVTTMASEGPQSSSAPQAPPSPSAAPNPAPATTSTSPYFYNCRISGNVNTSSSGGGILFDCSNVPVSDFTPTYDNCIITGNSTLFSGGGIAVCGEAVLTNIAPIFTNCTVSANSAGIDGGGIYIAAQNEGSVYSGYATVTRSIMWGNCADGSGDQAFMEPSNFVSFDCSNFDTLGVAGAGNVVLGSEQAYEDPMFCDAATCIPTGTITGNFDIADGSPDDPTNSPCGLLIGANPVACTTTAVSEPPVRTALWQNVPNPFNPVTSIRFDLAHAGHVTLIVYDVAGHVVRRLVDDVLPATSRTVTWDGRDDAGHQVATGVYFARLVTRGVVETRKMVMMK